MSTPTTPPATPPPGDADGLVAHLRAQGAPDAQLARLAALRSLAASQPGWQALFLVGSFARGHGDRISDLDLVAIAQPGQGPAVLQAAQALLQQAPVLNQFSRSNPAGGFCKLVYLDFSSVECHVFEPGAAFRLKRPCLPVWDPQPLLPTWLVDGVPIRHEQFAAYEHGDDGLIWELVDCIKWLSRGRTALAHGHLRKLADALASTDPPV